MAIPTREANPSGFHARYAVTKLSGKPVPEGAEYFVLRLDDKQPINTEHINACRMAVLAYADSIAGSKPQMARELYEKYNKVVGTDGVTNTQLKTNPHG